MLDLYEQNPRTKKIKWKDGLMHIVKRWFNSTKISKKFYMVLPVEFEPKQLGIFQEVGLKALEILAIPNKIPIILIFQESTWKKKLKVKETMCEPQYLFLG